MARRMHALRAGSAVASFHFRVGPDSVTRRAESARGDALTIAACYRSPEGIVLGADSTTTFGNRFFNHTQKVFEIGEDSTLGLVMWGLGGLGQQSYRTLTALLGDDLKANPPADVLAVANRWRDLLWAEYQASAFLAPLKAILLALHQKPAFDPNAGGAVDPNARTKDEEDQYAALKRDLVSGTCVAGYVLPDRKLKAYQVMIDPLATGPTVEHAGDETQTATWNFWGAPNMIVRLIFGIDADLKQSIVASPHWNGTAADLDALAAQAALSHPLIPIRDAVDFVHSCICSTIKALKFSSLAPTCGGPIELAVITSDRKFRWVRHKGWDTAITEGATI